MGDTTTDPHRLRWVFGHGSLMFAPGFAHRTRLPGVVEGWERRFGQPSVRNWGTVAAPAPTCSLVPGSEVTGIAFGVSEGAFAATIGALTAREARDPITVEVRMGTMGVEALTWPMSNTWADLAPGELAEAAVVNVRMGGGPSGDAWAYVRGVSEALEAIDGLDDLTDGYRRTLESMLGSDPGSR